MSQSSLWSPLICVSFELHLNAVLVVFSAAIGIVDARRLLVEAIPDVPVDGGLYAHDANDGDNQNGAKTLQFKIGINE